jgi:small subunit ribosomal protein S6
MATPTSQRYELMLLTVPEITQDEAKDVEKQINALIKDHAGSTSSFDRWGKYRLAYPVQKHEYGVYFLVRFYASDTGALNSEIRSLLRIRFDAVVMRSLLSTLEADAPSTYKRPRSLEETPQEEGASILKNKKVEGLISAVESRRGGPRKKTTDDIVIPELDDAYGDDMDDGDQE